MGPRPSERFWRSPHRAPLAVGVGVALVALLSQGLMPHRAYVVITSTLFTRETWLYDEAWTAGFLFLAVAWWLGARATGHRAYQVLPIGVMWMASSFLQGVTFIALLMAANRLPLGEMARAQTTDLIALGGVCLGVYAWMRTTLSTTSEGVTASTHSVRPRLYVLGLAVAVFAVATFTRVAPCGTVDCRAAALRDGVGEDVVRFVETYVGQSPAISQDVGPVQRVALRPGTRSHVNVWMDYDAELFLEVLGARGSGALDLSLAGNSYRDLGSSVGWWDVDGRRVPLDAKGAIDTIKLRGEATRAQEVELDAARRKSDCVAVLTIMARNEDADRNQTAFRFDQPDVSLWRAECAERAGDRRQAADAYALHASRVSPVPFQVEPGDAAKARRAQEFLAKAISLDPESPNRRWWDGRMKTLHVQERFAESPKDQALCLALKQALAEGRVHYRNACQ